MKLGSCLAGIFVLGHFQSLLEVVTRLDDDRGVSALNLDVVHLPEAQPDAPINDFLSCCFHGFLKCGEDISPDT